MDARKEYQRLRHNILRREKRIQAAGLARYVPKVNLPDSRGLSDKDVKKYLRKAKKYEETVSVSRAKAKRKAEREYKREWRARHKLGQNERNFIHGVKKWLKRTGANPDLVTSKNYKDWIDYIEYRRSIESSTDKYMFNKYVQDAEELLTDDEKKVDTAAVISDFKNYVNEQISFIEDSKAALDAENGSYSSDEIVKKYFSTRKKKKA